MRFSRSHDSMRSLINSFISDFGKTGEKTNKTENPQEGWTKCRGCSSPVKIDDLLENNTICPKCDFHFPLRRALVLPSPLRGDNFCAGIQPLRQRNMVAGSLTIKRAAASSMIENGCARSGPDEQAIRIKLYPVSEYIATARCSPRQP